MTKILLRVRRTPFLIMFCSALAMLCWSVHRTLHTEFVLQHARVLIPPLPREKSPPVTHAHEGWLIIRAWEQYMDSLRRDSSGKRRYNSILAAHPGILDSARKAETFYYSHDH